MRQARRGQENAGRTFQEYQEGLIIKIYGKNAVLERLRSGGGFNRIDILSGGAHDNRVGEIFDLARRYGIPVKLKDRAALDKAAEGNHQGCIGYATDFEYSSLDDIFAHCNNLNEPPFVVVLDGIEDPHNLGSILRTCECAGVHGVVIGKNRQVPVNDTVVKVAEGATEYVKVVRVVNINDAVRKLKEQNVWVYALDMDGKDIYKENLSGAVALVVGAEGKGVSKLTRELCDGVLSLPMRGHIQSLNASVAAAVGIYAKLQCDSEK